MSGEPSIKKEKEREILTDGLRILARIMVRKYLKNQVKIHDREIAGEKRSI
jgi:hypothetical protein